ncbi:response regulator [Gloeothece verrucosa]|uniref:Response regulator receiver modulated GAF sensor protein n=1 Tax=Gloeothece verrucosa (strain PCC 7822) TaxID=497965 RepID=E0UEP0_GLOV7|nr:response regulator [Gloeothece verrucosa]ADN16608.1 response regulator receiver modulated GAF sensor protein [Gloeothece verrucosa PCC 7822]
MTITEVTSSADIPLILVVDDDRSTRTLLKVAMEEEGYRVVTAKDGEECLNEYNRCQPDMVLLDAVMPEMDGFSCCKRLTEISQGHNIPILMITALDDQDSIDQAFACGAVDYITKPIHWAVLAQRVKRLLTTSKALVQLEQVQQQLHAAQKWMRFLGMISKRLSRPFVPETFLQEILDRLILTFPVQQVSLYQKNGQMRLQSTRTGYPCRDDLSAEFLELAAFYKTPYQQGKAIAIQDLYSTPNLPETVTSTLLNHHLRSILIVPILIQEQVWGVLCVNYFETLHCWEAAEIEQFESLANLVALSLNSERLRVNS